MLIPVVRRKLRRAQAQAIQVAKHAQVSIQIVTALDIEHSGHLAFAADSLHVIARERELDQVAVQFQLLKRVIDPA